MTAVHIDVFIAEHLKVMVGWRSCCTCKMYRVAPKKYDADYY